MPIIVTEKGIVHYEVSGRGRPVILLHGWLGSWALWRETSEELSKEYRTYALDFFGFGESRAKEVSVDLYVDFVYQFMEQLGIKKAPLIGHSMGGTVSLGVAARYPDKIVKVAIIGSPIVGSSLNPFLKLSGYKYIANMVYSVPQIKDSFIYLMTRFGAKNGRALHNMVKTDSSKVSSDAFFQSIGSLHQTDMTEKLSSLTMPILGIYGKKDIIVSPKQSKYLLQHAPTAKEAWFDDSGHFPMLDEPKRFHDTVREFLANG